MSTIDHCVEYALDSSANHCQAARALATKLSWEGNWRGGGMPDATGYVTSRA